MTSVHPVNVALDSVLTTAGISFHAGKVPPGTSLPYVVATDDSEAARSYHGRTGSDTRVNLHMWATTKMGVLDLYQAVFGLLHKQAIAIADREQERGRLSLITTLHDPPSDSFHLIAEFRTETLA